MKSRSRQFSTFALRLLLLLALASAAAAPVTPSTAQEADTTPPETYLDTVPPAATESTEATFGFSADDLDASFLCSLDGSEWAPCASPVQYSDLAPAAHQFAVIAADLAGNADQSPEIYDWTVEAPADTQAPETTLDAAPDTSTESTDATFEFSADDPDATFLCSLDGSDWESCTSPVTYTDLAVTPHQFGVSAVDAAGNADQSPEIHDWTISAPADTTAPTTTINSGPEGTSDNTAASFEFAADDPEASFECAIDGSDFAPCASPAAFESLAEGEHTFAVRATDAQGNVEDPPVTSAWTVAWEPLVESFESNDLAFWTEAQGDGLYLQDELVASGEYAVRGTSTGQATVLVKTLDLPQQDVYYRTKFNLVDRGDNPVTLLQLWNANGDLLTTLSVAADGRLAHQVGDDGTTQTTSVPVTESVWHEVEVRVGVDGANSVVEVWYDGNHLDDLSQSASLGSSPVGHVSLGNGATGRSYDVAFDDIALDTEFIPAEIEAPLVTAPETTIDGAPAASTTETTATFIFSADASDSSFACSLDGAAFTPCASPLEFTDVELGPHRFEVVATNPQGLSDETPAGHEWTVAPPPDTTAPVTTIGSGPAETTNATTATFTFSADEEGSTSACALDSGAFQPCSSPQTYSDLTEGTHVFQVQATDAAGNTDETPASASWTVDLTAPATSIDAAPTGSVAVTTATITFSAEDGATFTCAVDGGEVASCASPLDLTGLADGEHTVAVQATDAAGNADASPATSTWTVDTAAPETTLSSTPASVTNSTTAAFAFTSPDTSATFACRIDGGTFAPCTSPADYTGLAVSPHTFQVQATDAAGNTDVTPATYNWTVDTTAPDTTINGPTGTINTRTATVAFSSEANATFECALDNGAFSECVAPVTLNDLADGPHTYAVRAVDAAGNPDSSPAATTWTVDATAPTVSVSPAGGTYTAPQTVNVTSSEPGAVYYTTDGRDPTTSDPVMSAPMTISTTTTLKSLAVDNAGNASAVDTESYTIMAASEPVTGTFGADADTMIASASPNSNFGLSPEMRVDTQPAEESLLKFTVTGVSGSVTSAKVRLYVTNGTGNGPNIYPVANTWTETGVTWNNRPAATGPASDDLVAVAPNAWAEFDVTSIVSANGTYSFNLGRQSSDGVFFHTKEFTTATLRPQLVVMSGGADVLPPTVSASPAGATYNGPQSVALNASEPATIYYTTDGSDPTAASAVYTAPITISQTSTLKFFGVDTAGNASAIVTENYTINEGSTTVALTPVADAKVDGANPNQNYGATADLVSDGSPAIETNLMFTVSGLTGPVQNAKLRLYVTNNTVNGPEVFRTGTQWTETGVTWNNRPARNGAAIADSGAIPVNEWVEFDVASAITGNGTYAFTLVSVSSDAAVFSSREAATTTLRPQLVVTAQNGALPVVNATPAGGTYTSPQNVTLSASYSQPTTIHYTSDGTEPTTSSPVYTAPIAIRATTTLKFFAISGGGVSSGVKTETYTIVGDFVPPETTISSGPPSPTNQTTATFVFTSSESGSTFQCALDTSAFATCTSPRQLTGLAAGPHTFQVRATDVALNTDATPASFTWTVDLTAPTVTSTVPVADATNVDTVASITATFSEAMNPATLTTSTFSMTRQGSSQPVAAQVTYDAATRIATLNPTTPLESNSRYNVLIVGGASGVKDAAGNALATNRAWSFRTRNVGQPTTIAVDSAADSSVFSETPGVNYGTEETLGADTDASDAAAGLQPEHGYLKFNVSGIENTVTSARLRLFVSSGSIDGPALYATGNGWTETGITWNNKPATSGNAVGDLGNVASETWVEYNVTSLVTSNTTYSFAIIPTSDDGIEFESRQSAINQPELIIAFGGSTVTVSASPAGGTYTGPQNVTLTASEPATIYYTTDGSEPTTASTAYSSPVFIAGSTTLKFFAVTPDGRTSAITQQTYTIQVTGYRDFNYGTSHSAPTSKGPQSKLWYADGKWWGVLLNPTSRFFQIYRLDTATQTWSDTGTIVETRLLGNGGFGKFDVLWDGSKLYVVTHRFGTSGDVRAKVLRFSYAGGGYTQDYAATNVTPAGVGPEVVTIAKDSTGTLWLSWTHNNKVYVTHTTSNEQTWVTPYIIPVSGANVAVDDISAIVAFGGKVGVMWSNQAEGNPHQQDPNLMDKMYFAYHVDGAPDTAWTQEVAYDLPGDVEAADDHINLKVDSSGRVYAAAKTSLNASSEPLINLYVRGTGGTWSSHLVSTAGFALTRPIVQLDEAAGRVYVFASRFDAGSVIYSKSASMTNPVFPGGLGTPIIASQNDPKINNVTSTKQNVGAATGLVILASDDSTRTYLHNFLPLGAGGAGGTTVAAATVVPALDGERHGWTSTLGARPWTDASNVSSGSVAVMEDALDRRTAVEWSLLCILAAALSVYPGRRSFPFHLGTRGVRHTSLAWMRHGSSFRATPRNPVFDQTRRDSSHALGMTT